MFAEKKVFKCSENDSVTNVSFSTYFLVTLKRFFKIRKIYFLLKKVRLELGKKQFRGLFKSNHWLLLIYF